MFSSPRRYRSLHASRPPGRKTRRASCRKAAGSGNTDSTHSHNIISSTPSRRGRPSAGIGHQIRPFPGHRRSFRPPLGTQHGIQAPDLPPLLPQMAHTAAGPAAHVQDTAFRPGIMPAPPQGQQPVRDLRPAGPPVFARDAPEFRPGVELAHLSSSRASTSSILPRPVTWAPWSAALRTARRRRQKRC